MAKNHHAEEVKAQDGGPTSSPAGIVTSTDKPRRTRTARPKMAGLTQDDLRGFETYLTEKIQTGRKDDAVPDDQLEAWSDSRKRVRAMITLEGAQ